MCYGPRAGTIVIACAAAYALLHQVIGRVLHIAGLVIQGVLVTCAAAAGVALLAWTIRAVQRRRGAAGACATCRFRCQQPPDLRPGTVRAGDRQAVLLPVPPPPRAAGIVAHDGYLLTSDGVTGTSAGRPEGTPTTPPRGGPLVLD